MNPTDNLLVLNPAVSAFVCGLAWLAGAALILRGRIPQDLRSPRGWLFLVAVSQCLENWLQVAITQESGMAMFAGLSAALWAFSVVGLVEYAARRFKQTPLWMPKRWVYLPLALWTALSLGYLQGSGLEVSYKIGFAWAVSSLALRAAIAQHGAKASGWRMLSLAALAGYSLAVCCELTGVGSVLALLALLSVWRNQRAADFRACVMRKENGRLAPAWRRWAVPAAFAVALGAGCLWLGTADVPTGNEAIAPIEPTMDQLYAELEAGPVETADDELERQLKRCGTAAAPILGLVLAVWGLSRLPFAR